MMSQDFEYKVYGKVHLINWNSFAKTAWIIVQFPSSEALCERIFSHLALLFPFSRMRAISDLIRAQTMIRMFFLQEED